MATYEDIRKANESIQTTDIRGKLYAEVNQRIKAFRMVYPTGFIITEMLSNDGGVCVFKATVGYYDMDADGEAYILGVGHAYEKEGSTFINKTSYIENCETSATGRALGMAGFGIDTSVASAEEVQTAILNQNKPNNDMIDQTLAQPIDEPKWSTLKAIAKRKGVDPKTIKDYYGLKVPSEMTFGQWKEACDRLNKMKDKGE